MRKIKELWAKNKVLICLLLILLICFIAILTVCFTFFLGGSKTTYGDRLEDIEKYPITESFQNDYVNALESDALIKDVTFKTSGGRVIYIRIAYENDTTLVEAESKATQSLEKFSEDLLSYYDIDFTLVCDSSENSEGFTIMGAKNVSGSGVVWNNNTKVESEEQ